MTSGFRLVIIAAVLILGACSFSKDPEAKKKGNDTPNVIETISEEQERQAEAGILTNANTVLFFQELPTAGTYNLIIKWPASVKKMQVKINDDVEKYVSQTNIFEQIVLDDTEFQVRLISLDQFGSPISSLELKERSPKDIVVNKQKVLNEDLVLEANRLFLNDEAQYMTNGFNLSIKANKIFVEGLDLEKTENDNFWRRAHILTAIPNSIANSQRELLGSNISISAGYAQGHLRVALIGVNGQDGQSGAEIAQQKGLNTEAINPALRGANGTDGRVLVPQALPCFSHNMDVPCFDSYAREICEVVPTSGQDGLPGADGEPGEPGWAGGNTGNLFVFVENSEKFSLTVGKKTGVPGKGGLGGPGYIGGQGGSPGQAAAPCPQASAGGTGPRGNPGSNGADGKPGQDATIELGPFPSSIFNLIL